MIKEQYLNYIRKELLELSATRYPGDTHRQMMYQIGFMQAQLAHHMHKDSLVAYQFKQSVESANG
jgi:hypothetical protein